MCACVALTVISIVNDVLDRRSPVCMCEDVIMGTGGWKNKCSDLRIPAYSTWDCEVWCMHHLRICKTVWYSCEGIACHYSSSLCYRRQHTHKVQSFLLLFMVMMIMCHIRGYKLRLLPLSKTSLWRVEFPYCVLWKILLWGYGLLYCHSLCHRLFKDLLFKKVTALQVILQRFLQISVKIHQNAWIW